MRRFIFIILTLTVIGVAAWLTNRLPLTSLQSLLQPIQQWANRSSDTEAATPTVITRSLLATTKAKSTTNTEISKPILKIETGFHAAIINKMALTRRGKLLTVSDDKTARLWQNINEPAKVLRVPIGEQSEGALYTVAVSPNKDIAVVGGSTGISSEGASTVYSFDLNSGELVGRIPGIPGTIQALKYSPDSKYLAIGTSTGLLRVIDLLGKTLATYNNDCSDTVTAVEFLSDNRLLTACLDGNIRLYDNTFQLIAKHSLEKKQRPWQIALAPDQTQVAIASLDVGTIDLLSLKDLTPSQKLVPTQTKSGVFSSVAWADGVVFAAGTYGNIGGDKLIHTWHLKTGQQNDFAVAKDTITDLVPLSVTELAYATAEALIGKVQLDNQAINTQARLIPDYRDAYQGQFALSKNGTILQIGKAQGGKQPVLFNFLERTLTENNASDVKLFNPQIPSAVKNWRNSKQPTLNGKIITLEENEYSRSIASLNNNNLVLLGADYSLRLFKQDQKLWQISLASPAWAVNLTQDGKYAVAALGDGTLHWFNTQDASEAMALFITTDNRWIAWTPQGYFDHSDEIAQLPKQPALTRGLRPVLQSQAAKLVGYHINRGSATPSFISSEQIQRDFYRPDLVSQKFYSVAAVIPANPNPDAQTVLTQAKPPALKSLAWCNNQQCNPVNVAENPNINVNVPEITLRYELSDQGSGIGNVVLKRNGAAVATRGLRVNNAKEKSVYEQKIRLDIGDNPISLAAFDATQSVQSDDKLNLVIHYAGTTENKPSLYVLSIGINHYQSPEINKLVNAANDANGIEALLKNQRDRFQNIIAKVLVDEQVTLKNIGDNLKLIADQAKPSDVVIVFIAGHGVVIDRHYYFLPYELKNISSQEIQAHALSDETLADLVSNFSTSRVAILIDSCYAGNLAQSDIVVRHSQDATWTGALSQSTGRFVLAATANDQEALDGKAGHGIFTAVLLDALSGKADLELRGNKDNKVDVVELSEYAKHYVPEEAKKLDPSHAQKATGFFMGADFFELVDSKP